MSEARGRMTTFGGGGRTIRYMSLYEGQLEDWLMERSEEAAEQEDPYADLFTVVRALKEELGLRIYDLEQMRLDSDNVRAIARSVFKELYEDKEKELEAEYEGSLEELVECHEDFINRLYSVVRELLHHIKVNALLDSDVIESVERDLAGHDHDCSFAGQPDDC